MRHRAILVGLGAMGEVWCHQLASASRDRVEVVAAVDTNPERLALARNIIGIDQAACHTDAASAIRQHAADFVIVVTTPATHEAIIDLALARGLDVLSEKPIADSLAAACRVAAKVQRAGRRMGVTMSHRFDQDKTSLREAVRSGNYGRLDYLVCRFTCPCRDFAAWGKFRHEIPDPLMIEGAVHHLDLLADIAGAPCETLYASTWNPAWGQFAGDSQGHVAMTCANGVRVLYEGAKTNAVGLNCWGQEYIRAECERATLILDHRTLRCLARDEQQPMRLATESEGIELPLLAQPHWSNAWLTDQFLDWREGGPPMPTHVEANLQSMALIFAAIESSRQQQIIRVQHMLAVAREAVQQP